MASYQHDSKKNGEYEPINGNGSHPSDNKGKSTKKWMIAAVIVVVGILLAVTIHKPAGASTDAAIKKSGLPLNEDGSVKLFDHLSKYTHTHTHPTDRQSPSLVLIYSDSRFCRLTSTAAMWCVSVLR